MLKNLTLSVIIALLVISCATVVKPIKLEVPQCEEVPKIDTDQEFINLWACENGRVTIVKEDCNSIGSGSKTRYERIVLICLKDELDLLISKSTCQ
jgi:hypothetical protein